jgi:WD repeat-containing protein 61
MKVEKVAEVGGHRSGIYKIAAGPDDQKVITLGGDGQVVEWDLRQPENGLLRAKSEYKFFTGCFSRTVGACFAGDMNGSLYRMFFGGNSEEVEAWKTHEKGTFSILDLNEYLLTGGGDGTLTRWTTDPFFPKETLPIAKDRIRSLIWDDSRELIVAGSSDGCIYLLEPDKLKIVDVCDNAHDNTVFSLLLLDDGTLVSGGRDAMLHFWKYPEMQLDHAIPAHLFTINDLAKSPCGTWFATASRDKEIRIWDSRSRKLVKVIDRVKLGGHINSVNSLFWDPGSSYLCSAGDDRMIKLWEIR